MRFDTYITDHYPGKALMSIGVSLVVYTYSIRRLLICFLFRWVNASKILLFCRAILSSPDDLEDLNVSVTNTLRRDVERGFFFWLLDKGLV